MSDAPDVILASASPRRSALLERLGIRFRVRPADVDETVLPDESPQDHVRRLALEKARAVARLEPAGVVIGGDTVVALGREILGKPDGPEAAVEMLLRLQGRRHTVHSGVAVVPAPADGAGRAESAVVSVDVSFRAFGRETAAAYVATGEPLDKAGAYGIQGKGSALVESISGDYFAVVGLPVHELLRSLERVGYAYDFRGLRSMT